MLFPGKEGGLLPNGQDRKFLRKLFNLHELLRVSLCNVGLFNLFGTQSFSALFFATKFIFEITFHRQLSTYIDC